MRTLLILLALAVVATSFAGCTASGQRTMARDCAYFHDDLQRAVMLDQPSALHPRDNVADDVYEPYHSY